MSEDRPATPRQPENAQDEDAIAFAQGIFELARNGGATMLAPLLEAGVPVDMRTSDGDTLLTLAVRNGHLTTARLLLARAANPDQQGSGLRTPLMEAAVANHAEIVDELLEAGADAGLTDANSRTALDLARGVNAEDAVQRLEAVS